MKVKIGSLEITDVTPEELDEIIQKYGNIQPDQGNEAVRSVKRNTNEQPSATGPSGAADVVLLRKLVDGGLTGVTTIDVGEILGRRGKAARPALKDWARRIGLTVDDNLEPFEEARVGTQRGLRLKPSLIDVARHLLNQT